LASGFPLAAAFLRNYAKRARDGGRLMRGSTFWGYR
jgi:hypothetical protein